MHSVWLRVTLVALCVAIAPSRVVGDPHIWLGFYGDDLPTTSQVTTLHIASDIQDAVNAAHYGQKSVLLLQTYLVAGGRGSLSLQPNWQSTWASMQPVVTDLLNNGTIIGFDLGDELAFNCMPVSQLEAYANAVRASFPSAIIWYNEAPHVILDKAGLCGNIDGYNVPRALSWYSVDKYHMDGQEKDWVENTVESIYHQYVRPLLGADQRFVLIPGAFGSNLNSKCDKHCYDHMCAYDAKQYVDWALSDGRVAAIFVWTYASCGSGCDQFKDELGFSQQPLTKAAWWNQSARLR